MPFINYNTRKKVKIWDGIEGPIAHSGLATFGHFQLKKGSVLPEHQHEQEQWCHVIEGRLEFTIAGETAVLSPGMTAYIPSNAPHSAKAVTEVKVIDCFVPARPDLNDPEDQRQG